MSEAWQQPARGGSKSRSRNRSAARSQASFPLENSSSKIDHANLLPSHLPKLFPASLHPAHSLLSALLSLSSASIIEIVSASAHATRDIHLLCVRPRRAPTGQSACSSRASDLPRALRCVALPAPPACFCFSWSKVQGPLTRLGPRCYSHRAIACYCTLPPIT